MHLVHLTASAAFGGPERQILGLSTHLPPSVRSTVLTFREQGGCEPFLAELRAAGVASVALRHDTPHLASATREIATHLQNADVILCHGYKSALLGRVAARRVRVPAVAVSRGWTAENWKVRAYTLADRAHLRAMDHVVCVSAGQANRVRQAGVPPRRLSVIHNSARLEAFAAEPEPSARAELAALFPTPPRLLVLAAGRFSPEKGFDVLLEAFALARNAVPDAALVVFGDGAGRAALEAQITRWGLTHSVRLPGFTSGLDRLLAAADVVALSSHSEGLPNVLLEAAAAGVPVAATAVGGVPEIVVQGVTGLLAPPAHPAALGAALVPLLSDRDLRIRLGTAARAHVAQSFTFSGQAAAYLSLLERLTAWTARHRERAAC